MTSIKDLKNKKRILFYASVNDMNLFHTQKFYCTDIRILSELGYDVITSNKILDFIFFWKYDVSFIYFYRYGLFPAIISKLTFHKVYFTGGIDDLDKDYASRKNYLIQAILFKLCYFFSDKCIIVSSADLLNVKKIFRGNIPRKINVSHHAIDTNKYISKTEIVKNNNFVTIAWMGTISNIIRKGLDEALLFFKLLSEYPEFYESKFYIVGKKGQGTEYLLSKIKDLNLQDKVIFTGEISEEDKINFLLQSKVYFQLSKYEGFGLAALEALAAKNIIIHTGVGGLIDSVGNYGIKVEYLPGHQDQMYDLYNEIVHFNTSKLIEAQKNICDRFSIECRRNEFKKIIKTSG